MQDGKERAGANKEKKWTLVKKEWKGDQKRAWWCEVCTTVNCLSGSQTIQHLDGPITGEGMERPSREEEEKTMGYERHWEQQNKNGTWSGVSKRRVKRRGGMYTCLENSQTKKTLHGKETEWEGEVIKRRVYRHWGWRKSDESQNTKRDARS